MSRPGPASAQFNAELFDQLMGLVEGVAANAMNQFNRFNNSGADVGYDPQMRASQPFTNAGLPPIPAEMLGLLLNLAIPDPTDFASVPRAATRAAEGIRDVVRNVDSPTPMTVFRAETPTGAGPMSGTAGDVSFASVDPDTARALAYPGTRVLEATVSTRPGGFVDFTTPNFDTNDLLNRMIPNLDMSDPFISQSVAKVQSGESDLLELFRDLSARYGPGLQGIPGQSGIDAARFPANMGAVNRQTAAADEIAIYNREALNPINVYTDEEFKNLYPRRR